MTSSRKRASRLHHREQRLAVLRLRTESDEVHRVPRAHRHADLGIELEAADAGPMPGARIDDHHGAGLRVHRHVGGRQQAQQGVVAGPGQVPAVEHHLVVELKQRRRALIQMLPIGVAPIEQRVQKQSGALRGVAQG